MLGPGARLGDRYELIGAAGAGAMGTVFRARDLVTGQTVAVKVLRQPSVHVAERFAREARVLAELDHPRLPRYVTHGSTTFGEAYLVMEWLEGMDLAARLDAGPLGVTDTLRLGRAAAEALAVAHAHGIVHRDLKPSNLFLPGGRVEDAKLLDFGVAGIEKKPTRADLAVTVGTPAFMAPEQVRGLGDVDARADVFALGAVLYACLAGRPPFASDDDVAVLAKILLEEPPSLRLLDPSIPIRLDELVSHMLDKDPARRPASTAALAESLTELLGAASSPQPPPPSNLALGSAERHVMCLVLLRSDVPDDGEDGSRADTLDARPTRSGGPLPLRRSMRIVVEQHGGRLHRIPGGVVVASLVGSQGSPTDLAVRAVRTAQALREIDGEAPIAVVAGTAVASGAAEGAMVDAGLARLREAAAAPGTGIWVDEMIAGLVQGSFTFDPRGVLVAARSDEQARTLLGKSIPLLGRERELAELKRAFDEGVRAQQSRIVLVTGAAGVGKSRLRQELVRKLAERPERPGVWLCQADPLRAGAPFGMLAPTLREICGVTGADGVAARVKKIRGRVAEAVPPTEVPRVAEFLGELAGAPFPDDTSVPLRAARRDPVLMHDQMRRAWEEWIAAECAERPIVLLLEDLHWGDWPSVRFVEAACRRAPLLVVAFARPEVSRTLPGLWKDLAITELPLAELSAEAAGRLVEIALGDELTAETRDSILSRAAGNAFYLEELCRGVAEGRSERLPDTVLAMVQARLEVLPAEVRRVLRAGSIFGGSFRPEGVAALIGEPERVAERLRLLVERELVDARPGGRLGFRSALVQEAAYAMLTAEDRALGHRIAGEWLAAGPDRDPLTLAEHFERGGLPGQAAHHLAAAAHEALAGNDLEAAVRSADRGLALAAAHAADEWPRLQIVAAEALVWLGRWSEAESRAAEVMKRLEAASELWCLAVQERATALASLGRHDELEDLAGLFWSLKEQTADPRTYAMTGARVASHLLFAGRFARARALLGRLDADELAHDDPAVAAAIYRAKGVRSVVGGDFAAALDNKAASVVCYDQAGDVRHGYLQRANLGSVYNNLGAFAQAADLLTDVVGAAGRMGLPGVVALAQENLAMSLSGLGRHAEARRAMEDSIASHLALGEHRMVAVSRADYTHVLHAAGDLATAEEEARKAIEASFGLPPALAVAHARLAEVLLARHNPSGALAAAEKANAVLDQLGGTDEGEIVIRLVWAEAFLATGLESRGRDALRVCRQRLLAVAERISDEKWRRSFLTNVPENARTLTLAGKILS